jgi:hypothetical protein
LIAFFSWGIERLSCESSRSESLISGISSCGINLDNGHPEDPDLESTAEEDIEEFFAHHMIDFSSLRLLVKLQIRSNSK